MPDASTTTRDRCWRVFYTTARAEKKCEERLQERGITVFLPKAEVVRQWKDRKKKVVVPLFPNYIFAEVDEHERLRVLRTPGIVRSVAFGGAPAEVDDEEIEQLQLAQQDPSLLRALDGPLPDLGTAVVVTEGPLKGLHGEVIQHRGQAYVIVRITAIRQAVSINVPAEWVTLRS